MAPSKILASQNKYINLYKNLRPKFMKCCANIYFNWQHLAKKVFSNYTKIKILYTSPATNITKMKVCLVCLKEEIKFLYMKKKHITKKLVY
jgi:hypothetical protein